MDEDMKITKAGIFIDDSNLFYAQRKAGWRIDIKKLRMLLEKEVNILFIHYHIAVPAKWDKAYLATQNYIEKINPSGQVIQKPLKYIRSGNATIKKGDVDLEIALDVVSNLSRLDVVLVLSGDSDYVVLREYVLKQGRKIDFMGFRENMAWEIKRGKYLLLNKLRKYIDLSKKTTPRNYPGRLLLDIL